MVGRGYCLLPFGMHLGVFDKGLNFFAVFFGLCL